MTFSAKGPPPGGEGDPLECQLLAGADSSERSATKTAPAQENLLLEAINALAAAEIRADTLEKIPLALAASGWRSTAALLTHAAGCAEAGDFLAVKRNRQRARELFIEANDAFRQFMEARAAQARAEAYQ